MISRKKGNVLMPVSIIVAGFIIAGAVMFSNSGGGTPNLPGGYGSDPSAVVQGGDLLDSLNPVTEDDHIKGDLNAPIKIVEFSDFECPFCGKLHPILSNVVDKYDGQVAWVYRHFPLSQIHVNAQSIAEATECVAELGGNDAFWEVTGDIFKQNLKTTAQVGSSAAKVGVDQVEFQSCVDSGRHRTAVLEDVSDATGTGGRGTPWAIVVGPNGEKFPLSGAQPEAVWVNIIDQLI
jgi:protein-disulfide isomerase